MRRSPLRIILTLLAVVVIAAIRYAQDDGSAGPTASAPSAKAPASTPLAQPSRPPETPRERAKDERAARGANAAILDAFRQRKSDVWLDGAGTVEALLPDDRQGSRHQKFIVRIDRELTILVSHNIDLAPRVPVDKGDAVAFRGEYVWNAKGGLVHWTHHDPRGGRGGFVRLDGTVYE